MNGEDLLYDWQHNVVREPSEWAFNWEYAECGTTCPTPREHHATCWLIMNVDRPSQALRAIFTGLQRQHPCKLKMERDPEDSNYYKLTVTHKTAKKKIFLLGRMGCPPENTQEKLQDPNVGKYAVFESYSKEGLTLIQAIKQGGNLPGYQAYVAHSRVETTLDVDPEYRVVSVTGFGPNWVGTNVEDDLATRFTLYHEDEEVARCHLSYRDGSWDRSMGPTIEMIAVKQSRRGEGLAKVLFYWVRKFVEDHFTIECLNNDAPQGHIMIKATQINTNEIEMRKDSEGSLHPVGFKEFLYDYSGFSVRPLKGAAQYLMGGGRPKDEEAVLYVPLITPQSKRKTCPKPGHAIMREKCGARCCQWCLTVGIDLQRCTRCGIAFYCKAACQRSDWKRHKKWCNKTREQVRELMIEEGHLEVGPDGRDVLTMNGPNATFNQLR